MGIVATILLGTSFAWAGKSEYISYEEFIDGIKKGQVKRVEFDSGRKIQGVLVEKGKDKHIRTFFPDIAERDPLLRKLLKGNKVAIDMKPSSEKNSAAPNRPEFDKALMFTSCLFFIIPIAVAIIVMVLLFLINSRVKEVRNRLIPQNIEQFQSPGNPSL